MARLLCILCSPREKGFTAGLLRELIEGAREVEGVEVEYVNAANYKFGPCEACFFCIRNPGQGCSLKDDFGYRGEGELFKKVINANGMILATPVYFWGPSALAHIVFERLYPLVWAGELNGMPFGSITCASNTGFQLYATREICRWAMGPSFRYIGGVSAHLAYYEEAKKTSRILGKEIAETCLKDEREGRKKMKELEKYEYYLDKPWTVLEPYLENLTNGTYQWENSVIKKAFINDTFKNTEAINLLKKAGEELQEALKSYNLKDMKLALKHLAICQAYWTTATWKEFVFDIVKAEKPKVYQPLPKEGLAK